jgi:hypothetical protein
VFQRVVQQAQFIGAVGFWRRQSIEVDTCRVIDTRHPAAAFGGRAFPRRVDQTSTSRRYASFTSAFAWSAVHRTQPAGSRELNARFR